MIKHYVGYYKIDELYLKIKCSDDFVISSSFCKNKDEEENKNDLVKICLIQLDNYFNRRIDKFNLPFDLLEYSSFEEKVLNYLINNPNELVTYSELAEKINHKNASRAVGTVMSKNKYAILIPCHLVVKKNELGNYSNAPISMKKKLILLSTGVNYE